MSYRGISPIEFVRQVYYAQEKVYLDFVPSDDKYKEVLLEANFVLQELQKEEDWQWLRSQAYIGITDHEHKIYELPEDFYKASTLFDDAIRLYHRHPCTDCDETATPSTRCQIVELPQIITAQSYDDMRRYRRAIKVWGHPIYGTVSGNQEIIGYTPCDGKCIRNHRDYILVPWVSAGQKNNWNLRQTGVVLRTNVPDHHLGATIINNKLEFNRFPCGCEEHRLIQLDYQRVIKPLHICDETCTSEDYYVNTSTGETTTVDHSGETGWVKSNKPRYDTYDAPGWYPCQQIEDNVFEEIPDPLYVIIKTAQYHAEGSPAAQGRIAGLNDQAQKILSSMRENNAVETMPDFVEHWVPGFFFTT